MFNLTGSHISGNGEEDEAANASQPENDEFFIYILRESDADPRNHFYKQEGAEIAQYAAGDPEYGLAEENDAAIADEF